MTEAERIARAEDARRAWEFVGPIIDEIDAEYVKRLRTVSTTTYSYRDRSDRQTALSTALVVTDAIRSGLNAAMLDGELAERSLLRAEKVEKMTAPQRRLLNIVPR